MNNITKYVEYVSILSVTAPLGLFIYLKNVKSKITNLLIVMVVVSGFLDVASFILALQKIPNAVVINTFFILHCIFAIIIYYHIYLKSQNSFRSLAFASATVFLLLNVFFWQGTNTMQNMNWMLTSVIIIAMSYGHFIYLSRYPVASVRKFPPYWISTGFLFYCSFSFAIFGISKFMLEYWKMGEEFRFVWMFHNINNIGKNGFFAVAIWWAAYGPIPLTSAKSYEN